MSVCTVDGQCLFYLGGNEMKETYKVKRPERLVFGDPLYFKEYEGELLKKLTVDITPPDHFSARVTLEEAPVKGCPGLIGRVMTIYLAPERTMQTYRSRWKIR